MTTFELLKAERHSQDFWFNISPQPPPPDTKEKSKKFVITLFSQVLLYLKLNKLINVMCSDKLHELYCPSK